MQTIKALSNQTPVDLALQATGSIETWFDVAQLNGLSITDNLTPGVSYIVPETIIDKQAVVAFSGTHKPASGLSNMTFKKPGGIGFMQIGNDFKVS